MVLECGDGTFQAYRRGIWVTSPADPAPRQPDRRRQAGLRPGPRRRLGAAAPAALAAALRSAASRSICTSSPKRTMPARWHARPQTPAATSSLAAVTARSSVVAAALVGHPDATLGILALGSFNNMRPRLSWCRMTLDAPLTSSPTANRRRRPGWVVGDGSEGTPFFEAAGVGVDAIGFIAVEIAERRGWWRAIRASARPAHAPHADAGDDRRNRVSDGSPAVDGQQRAVPRAGFAVSADADPTDGLLDVAVFHGMSRWDGAGPLRFAVARRQSAPRAARCRHRAHAGQDRGH